MVRDHFYVTYFLENLIVVFIATSPVIGKTKAICEGDANGIALQINFLGIPSQVMTGDSAILTCDFELGTETLYAVKWYKNMGEFFRYVPRKNPPYMSIPQPGVNVDMGRSTKNVVYLHNLELESFGNYTCQVSTDQPYYRCVQTTRQLEVIVPPSNGPVLMETKSEYRLGDNVTIVCSSMKSKPAAELRWYINDNLVSTINISDQEIILHPDNLESSSLVLEFNLKRDYFQDGKVMLKCVASVYQSEVTATKEIRASS